MTPDLRADTRRLRLRSMGMVLLCVLIAVLIVLDIVAGGHALAPVHVFQALVQPDQASPTTHLIIRELRAPQALMAALVGAALGLAGAEMQTVLDNPLASPFTLGVSSAAALGAVLALALNLHIPGLPLAIALPLNAFLGGLLCAMALDLIARRSRDPSLLILFGIALVFSLNAVVSLIQLIISASALQDMVFWTMGSLSRSQWPQVLIMALLLATLLPASMASAWKLTALRFGDERALSLGVSARTTRRFALLRASLLASVAVALVGVIGFIGLMAPHMARRLFGEDHRWYLPASACLGAIILLAADILSRLLATTTVIPVGILTTLVGIPFFLAVLARSRRPS